MLLHESLTLTALYIWKKIHKLSYKKKSRNSEIWNVLLIHPSIPSWVQKEDRNCVPPFYDFLLYKHMHDLFPSINLREENSSLIRKSYNFTSTTTMTAMNFNLRHRRKKRFRQPNCFPADINGSIFQSQMSNLFSRCRSLSLFKRHSNRFLCVAFPYLTLPCVLIFSFRSIFTCQR